MSKVKIKGIIKKDYGLYIVSPSGRIGLEAYKNKKNIETDSMHLAEVIANANTEHNYKKIVIGGLEPFDTPKQTWQIVRDIRTKLATPIYIETMYSEDECRDLRNRECYWTPITTKYDNIFIVYQGQVTKEYQKQPSKY